MVRTILHVSANPTVRFSCISYHNGPYMPAMKPAEVKVAKSQPHWASLQAEVEAHLSQAMPIREPAVVFEPVRHLTFTAPRSTVPALCLAACELVGGNRRQAMAAASALMLLGAASYTHEHLPVTDRPKPGSSKPHVFGPNIELLTADGIGPFGFELLSRSDGEAHGNSERALRVIVEISRAVGAQGLIHAQYMKALMGRHVEGVKGMLEKGEGGLHACASACGAVLGGGSEEEIERLRRFGFHVGMVQGMVSECFPEQEIQEARDLAFKELRFFQGRDVDVISSFVHV